MIDKIKIGDTVTPKKYPVLKGKVMEIKPFAGSEVYVLENKTMYTKEELDLERK